MFSLLMTSFYQSMHWTGRLFLRSICTLYMFVSGLISCCFFQVFHILLFSNQCLDSAGRKLYFRKCLSKILLPRTIANHVRKRKHGVPAFSHSQIQLQPNPLLNGRRGLLYFFFPVIVILLMDVTEIHSSYSPWLNTPAQNLWRNVLQVKVEFYLEWKTGHWALTQVLSDDVMLSKPPWRQQKWKIRAVDWKNARRQRLEETLGMFLAALAGKVVLPAGSFFLDK